MISDTQVRTLMERGIDYIEHEASMSITTRGLYWLFNFISSEKEVGLLIAPKTLKNLATFSADATKIRELRIKATTIPTYEDDGFYHLLMFYLNATPPKMLYATSAIRGLDQLEKLELTCDLPWKVRDGITVFLQLTPSEISTLMSGDTIRVNAG